MSKDKRQKKRVVHITTVHQPYDTRIFLKECVSLADHGFEVILFAPILQGEIRQNVVIRSLPIFQNKFFRVLFSWIPVIYQAFKSKANIYHLHDPELIVVCLILSFFGKKVVYDVHEDYEYQILNKTYLPRYLRNFIATGYKWMEKICLYWVSAIVSVTPEIAKKYDKFSKRNVILRNFPIIDEFRDCRKPFGYKNNEVCYVGGITKLRGVFDYIEAMSSLASVKLNLGGDYFHLKSALENTKGWKNVTAFGFVDRKQIKQIFKNSKVGLVVLHPAPNYIEALPVKMFEYMAAGLPVICSDFEIYRQIVEDNECGYCISPNNPELIAETIERLIDDEKLWTRLSKNAIRAIEEKYSWEVESKVLIDLYNIIS